MKVKKLNTRAPLDRSPRQNEVERRGGLPMYIRRIANHLHAEKGMSIGHAIAVAKNAADRMCSTGDLNFKGRQNVNPGSRAEACAAIADWNARIKGSGVSKSLGITTQRQRDQAYIIHLVETGTHGISKAGFDPNEPRDLLGRWMDLQARKRMKKPAFSDNPYPPGDMDSDPHKLAMMWANLIAEAELERKVPRKPRKKPEVVVNPDGSVSVTVGKKQRVFSMEQRDKLKSKGLTDSHGGFPLPDRDAVRRAVQAIGRAKNPAMEKKRIIARANKLGCSELIPDSWKVGKLSDKEFEDLIEKIYPDDPDTVEFAMTGAVEKVDAEKRLVFGWASVAKLANGETVVDKQGDVLDDLDRVEKVAYDFVVESRDGGEMHVRKGVSTLVESFVSTQEKREKMGIPEGVLPDGWWVGFRVNDPQVWKSVKDGKYRMFSVHGTGTRKALEDAD